MNADETPLEREYAVTVKVLAVLVERLLAATKAERIEIDDRALMDTPDLIAWREARNSRVILTASR